MKEDGKWVWNRIWVMNICVLNINKLVYVFWYNIELKIKN